MYVQRNTRYAPVLAERNRDARRSKLFPKAIGPFAVKVVCDEVITIDKDGIRHPVSIDSVTFAHPRCGKHRRSHRRGQLRKRTQATNEVHVVQKQLTRRGPKIAASTWSSGLDT